MKTSAYALLAIVVIVAIGGAWYLFKDSTPMAGGADYKNISYTIEDKPVALINGVSAEGTARYFGNEVKKDLNGDGVDDVVFIMTQNMGGSGTFYYAVAAVSKDNTFVGSKGYLLGDRIAPQTTESGEGSIVIVNYADRKPGEPFTSQPSVGKSVSLTYNATTNALEPVAPTTNDVSDLIHVTSPKQGASVSSPITITGEARGGWYFEASFPIYITDWDGKIIAEGHAEAQSDWMTSEFVPFKATLTFDKSKIQGTNMKGTLVLKNDNPSGLPANDKAIEIPIVFK